MQVIFYFTSFTSEDKLKIRKEFSYLAIPKVIVSFYGSIISKLNSQYYKILDFIYPAISDNIVFKSSKFTSILIIKLFSY